MENKINMTDFKCLIQKIKTDRFVEEHKCGNSVVTVTNTNRQDNPDTVFIFSQDNIPFAELELTNFTFIVTTYTPQFVAMHNIIKNIFKKDVNTTILCNGCKYKQYCKDNTPNCNPLGYCSILDMM